MAISLTLRRDLLALDASRREAIRIHSFYTGTQAEFYVNHHVETLLRQQNMNVYHLNACATAVDAINERIEVAGVATGDDKADAYLAQIWEDSNLGLEFLELHRLACEYGSSYLLAWLDETSPSGFSAYAHGPGDVMVFYHPERPRETIRALHTSYLVAGDGDETDQTWMTPGRTYLQAVVYYPDVVQTWVSHTPIDDGTIAGVIYPISYQTIELDMLDEVPNPFDPIIPVYHYRTSRAKYGYGESLLEPAIPMQLAIDQVLIGLIASVQEAAYHQRFILSELGDQTGDSFDAPPGPTAPGEATDVTRDFEAGPGALWSLKGNNVRVGSFDASDSENFIKPLQFLLDSVARVCDLPSIDYRGSSGGPLSGEALRQAEQPLVRKIANIEANFGVSHRAFFTMILQMAGMGGSVPQVLWAPVQRADDQAFWTTAVIKHQLGMPLKDIFMQSGVLESQAEEWADAANAIVNSAPPIIDDTNN